MTFAIASCASFDAPNTSPSPSQPWNPPASAVPPPLVREAPPAVPAPLTLESAIDIALANNPATRTAWLEARRSEEIVGSVRASYLPEVDVTAQASRTRQNGTSYGAGLALTYLLLDFGGRAAQVEVARQTLIAADFNHNQALQDVVLAVEQAYYGVLNAKALVDAQSATLKERETSLDAAQARHRAGVATVADELEAQTALSQAQLNYETFDGLLRQREGLLATTMGIPVTTRLELGALPADVPAQEVAQAVDALIAQAENERPALAAARAAVERAQARVRAARSEGLPTFNLSANTAHNWFVGGGSGTASPYSIAIGMRFPLFTGFRNMYDIRAAQTGVEIAAEDARGLRQLVALQVWSSYHAMSTAAQRVRTSRDLLRSASESLNVTSGRYRSGVGNILDVLTAQAALESARAQEVQARADWFLAVAQLAHDTGTLGPRAGETR